MIGLSELRAQGWKYGCLAVLAIAAAGWGCAGMQSYRLQVAKGATAILARDAALASALAAEATTQASEAAREQERISAAAVDAADKAYQRGKADAQAAADHVAAGLRAGNLQLREQWRGCEARGVSDPAASTGRANGLAELRAAGTGDLVGIGAKADAWIRAVQAIAEADRGQHASRPGN